MDNVRHGSNTEGYVRHKNNTVTKAKKPTNTIIRDGTYPSQKNTGAKNRHSEVTNRAKDIRNAKAVTDKTITNKSDYNSEIELPSEILKDVRPTTKSHDRASKSCHEAEPKRYSFHTESDLFCLKEDKTVYFRSLDGVVCLNEGTDFAATNRKNNKECVWVQNKAWF